MIHNLTIIREIEIEYDYEPESRGSYLVPPESATVYIYSVRMDGEEIKLPISEIEEITRQILKNPPERPYQ